LENHELAHAKQALRKYLASFKQKQLDTLVLGCTHYCVLKQEAKNILGSHVRVITQDQIIPKRLAHYLRKHPELRTKLSTHRTLTLLYTKYNKYYALPQNQVSLFDGQVFRIVHLPPLTGGRA
jgi:glutamate racemase